MYNYLGVARKTLDLIPMLAKTNASNHNNSNSKTIQVRVMNSFLIVSMIDKHICRL